jgi:serine/threonine protein kinase
VGSTHTDVTGTLLAGRYRLGRVLGRGGMSEVRSAFDELAGRTVAVKLFRTDLDEPGLDERRESEWRIAEKIQHPGVVRVHAAASHGGRSFLVMELVLGSTLEELAADGPIAPDVVADLGAQLADTLAAVHEAGVIHRDVKPSNVLLASAGRGRWQTKLTDFGISRHVDGTRLTSTGLLVGTARYLSPEQAAGEPAGLPSDVFSLGLVLLECLTGTKSFPGSLVETTVARLTRPPDIPERLGSFGELLSAMTARRPEDRPTMAQAAAALHVLAARPDPLAVPARATSSPTVITPAPVAPTGQAQPAARRRVRRSLVGAAAALALGVSLTGLLGNDPADRATASSVPTAGDGNDAKAGAEPSLTPPQTPAGTLDPGGATAEAPPGGRTGQGGQDPSRRHQNRQQQNRQHQDGQHRNGPDKPDGKDKGNDKGKDRGPRTRGPGPGHGNGPGRGDGHGKGRDGGKGRQHAPGQHQGDRAPGHGKPDGGPRQPGSGPRGNGGGRR